VVDGMVAAQVACPAVPPVSLTASEGPVLALDFTIPANGPHADVLHEVRLENLGNAMPADLAELALWSDSDGDGVFVPASDTRVAELTGIGADWVALGLDLDIPAGGRRLFAGMTVADTPTDSATVRLSIPAGGLLVASANDGPHDAPVVSETSLLISTAPLLSSLAFAADRSTTEMTVQATMTVHNVGSELVESIAPTAPQITGNGAVTLVTGPQPATLDLAPGATGTFTWTYAGAAQGVVYLTARCEGTGAVGGQPRSSLATASAAHRVVGPALDLGLYPVANMPFSINRGQAGVVPMTLTLLNEGGEDRAELRLEQLVVTLDDGEGGAVVPAQLLSRVSVNEGVNVYCNRTELETGGTTLTLPLDPPVVVTPREPVSLGLRLDIAPDTDVERFRIGLETPGDLVVRDHVSGAGRTVTLVEGDFPVRSAAGSIVTQATGLTVASVPGPDRAASAGQDDLPLLSLSLAAEGADGGSEVRVGRFSVSVVDTLGARVGDAASRLTRLWVLGPLAVHAVHELTSPADSVVEFTLAPQVAVPVGAGAVELEVRGAIAEDPTLGPLRLRLEPAPTFDARDANVSAVVPVVYAPQTIAGPVVAIEQPTPALALGGSGQLPATISQGSRGLAAMTLVVAHPGAAGTAAARLDSLRLTCLDASRQPRSPEPVLDGYAIHWNGEPVPAPVVYEDADLVVPLGGRLLHAGDQVELALELDIEADAPALTFEFVAADTAISAVDANLGTPVTVTAAAGTSLPISSGLARLVPAAEEVLASWTDRLPPLLPPDATPVEAARLVLRNPGPAGSAPAEFEGLTLHATDADGVAILAGAAVTDLEVRLDGEPLAATSAAAGDSSLTLSLPAGPFLEPGESVELQILITARDGAVRSGLRLGLGDGDIRCVAAGSETGVAVRAESGQSFPFWTAPAGLASADLAASYINFPNPFAAGRQQTNFAFQLAEPGRVTLRIWTPRGEPVLTLLRERALPAGLHQDLGWDGRNGKGTVVRNGVYVAELEVAYDDGQRQRLLRKVAVLR
jgi:hypothetical protein